MENLEEKIKELEALGYTDALDMANEANQQEFTVPCYAYAEGKKYKVRKVGNKVLRKINMLSVDAMALAHKQKKESITAKEAKQISKKLYTLHAKTAAYYLLGNWAFFVPFLWAMTWRRLELRKSEHTCAINMAGSSNEKDGFFFGNWEITRAQLELTTTMITQGLKQTMARMTNAMEMREEDLPTRQGNK